MGNGATLCVSARAHPRLYSPTQGQAPARVRARQTRVSAPQPDATDCLGRREYFWNSAAHSETISKTLKRSWTESILCRTQAPIGIGVEGRSTATRRAVDRGGQECAGSGGGQRCESQYSA